MKNKRQGSALVMVLISALVIGMITASILTLANGQRRVNIRKELQLQANNAAEASVDYAYSYLINEINAKTLAFAPSVPSSGAKAFTLPANALKLISDDIAAPAGFTGATSRIKVSSAEVKVVAPAADPIRFFVSPKDPANANDPNVNQWVQEQIVPLISKVTVQQGNEKATAYVHRGVSVREIYLFQHAIFFSGQLQLHRGFRPLGDVHSNGPLLINAHVGDVAKYTGFITTASKFYRGSTIDESGSGADAYGYTRVNALGELDFASNLVKPSATGLGITIFTGRTGTVDNYEALPKTFDSRMTGWKEQAVLKFKNHLKDISHQAPQLIPIGSSGYQLDAPGTPAVNEFNNGPYSLIEPLLPADHAARKQETANKLNLEANASLILRVEVRRDLLTTANPDTSTAEGVIRLYSSANPTGRAKSKTGGYDYPDVLTPDPTNIDPARYSATDLKKASNIADAFVIKAYKNENAGNSTSALNLKPLKLPSGIVGAARVDTSVTPNRFRIAGFGAGPGSGVGTGAGKGTYQLLGASGDAVFEPYSSVYSNSNVAVTTSTNKKGQTVVNTTYTVPTSPVITSGLHDARLGRGVDLISIDIERLRALMEDPIASLTLEQQEFRTKFTNWNGIIYVEFPTSLDIDYTPAKLYLPDPNTAAPNYYHEDDPQRNIMGPYESYAFKPGSAELDHPDRAAETDSRPDRTDRIVPIARQLRRYPSSFGSDSIGSRHYAIPGVQLINARRLPNPTGSPGFTIATNAPIYLVGSYNSDGNYATGSNILSTGADDYAEKDEYEVPAALFCDTFTALSDTWITNRAQSFYGWSNDASRRPVTRNGTQRIEIGACIATGEYPIFEFFFHALEDYNQFNSGDPVVNPIIVKGSVVGMFHSEIQHIKQAYGRDPAKDIQVYWNAHGAHAFTSVRYHDDLTKGIFPPGTPRAQVTYQVGYRLLRAGNADDKALLQQAGFL